MKVKLAADCYVEGIVRKAGETVDLPEEIAADFGEVKAPRALPPAVTKAKKTTAKK